MKVDEYLKVGLKNEVSENLEGLMHGLCKEGCHRLELFIKKENDTIVDCKFKATKRCKKLLAVSDFLCEELKGKKSIDKNALKQKALEHFKEEKEKDKIENRIDIFLNALDEAVGKT